MFLTIDHLNPLRRICLNCLGFGGFFATAPMLVPDSSVKRWEIINHLIAHNEKQTTTYLEIGCFKDNCFSRVVADRKIGVDPKSGGNFRGTSDKFFETNTMKFDAIFVDGDHRVASIRSDIENAIHSLSSEGFILVHDMMPVDEFEALPARLSRSWCGEGWRLLPALMKLACDSVLDVKLLPVDHGLALIKYGPQIDRFNGLDVCELDFFDSVVSQFPSWSEEGVAWLKAM